VSVVLRVCSTNRGKCVSVVLRACSTDGGNCVSCTEGVQHK